MDKYSVLCEVETELHVSYNLEKHGSSKMKFVASVSNTFLWIWLLTPGFYQFTSTVLLYRELRIQ